MTDEALTCPDRTHPGTDHWSTDRWSFDREVVARKRNAEDERGLREHNNINAERGDPPITLEEYWTEWRIRGATNDLWLWPGDVPRTCSYCGGIHPEDAIRLVAEGWEVDTTGKSYKRYLNPPGTWARLNTFVSRASAAPIPPDAAR